MASARHALPVTREENFSDWYQAVIDAARLAEPSGVRGCMVILPWGYAVWERLKNTLDRRIRETGHDNCYFPLFIPFDLIEKEAEHVSGFAKEMAVVTHHRVEMHNGRLRPHPDSELTQPLIVRPTSEAMIAPAFKRWIQSYRDLPVKINQWANVVRWEMRPRAFLRTSEFLWQEGHTAHATADEALAETETMLGVYRELAEDVLAIPVIAGVKSPSERFPGAEETHTIEAMMQDGRALQAGTSHFLGQNFSAPADIRFLDRNGDQQLVQTTSWGLSTRMIGALIMVHADDDGLRLPPRVAPQQIVIVPITRDETQASAVNDAAEAIATRLRKQNFADEQVRVLVDRREMESKYKRWEWIKKGVPLICEIGPRDLPDRKIAVLDRTQLERRSSILLADDFVERAPGLLNEIQSGMFAEAVAYLQQHTIETVSSLGELKAHFENRNGFVRAKWCGERESEGALSDTSIRIRCVPYEQSGSTGTCILTGKPATTDAIFGKAY